MIMVHMNLPGCTLTATGSQPPREKHVFFFVDPPPRLAMSANMRCATAMLGCRFFLLYGGQSYPPKFWKCPRKVCETSVQETKRGYENKM